MQRNNLDSEKTAKLYGTIMTHYSITKRSLLRKAKSMLFLLWSVVWVTLFLSPMEQQTLATWTTALVFLTASTRSNLSIDSDDAGEKLKAELIRRLGAEKCYVISLPGAKDANEFLVANGVHALASYVDLAEPVPLDNVNTLSNISSELEEFFFEGAKPGFQIGLPHFDSVFSTYTSQFIVVTGVPGSGKSDWIDMMTMGYQKNYGWKTAYASPENKPDYIHASKDLS